MGDSSSSIYTFGDNPLGPLNLRIQLLNNDEDLEDIPSQLDNNNVAAADRYNSGNESNNEASFHARGGGAGASSQEEVKQYSTMFMMGDSPSLPA